MKAGTDRKPHRTPHLEPTGRRWLRPLSLAERLLTWLLWIEAHVPDVVVSAVIVLPIVGLLPVLIAWLVLGAMMLDSALLATRWARWPAIGWFLGGTRMPSDVDAQIRLLLKVAASVSGGRRIELGLAAPGLDTTAVGPNVILIDRSLVDGYCAGKVDAQYLAFMLARQVARLRLGYSQFDLVVSFWCLPMLMFKTIGARLGRNSDGSCVAGAVLDGRCRTGPFLPEFHPAAGHRGCRHHRGNLCASLAAAPLGPAPRQARRQCAPTRPGRSRGSRVSYSGQPPTSWRVGPYSPQSPELSPGETLTRTRYGADSSS